MLRTLPLLLAASALLGLAACADRPATETASSAAADPMTPAEAAGIVVGEGVPQGEALSTDELVAQADALEGKTVTVEGTVREVCQKAGCWLTLAGADGQTVRVAVPKDEGGVYAFTFPTDASGGRVRLVGQLAVEEESVEDQRHYALDGGATEAEVAAITEPKRALTFTAIGAELADRAAEGAAPADNA